MLMLVTLVLMVLLVWLYVAVTVSTDETLVILGSVDTGYIQ